MIQRISDTFGAIITACAISLGVSHVVYLLGWPSWIAAAVLGGILLALIITSEILNHRAEKRHNAANAMRAALEAFISEVLWYRDAAEEEKIFIKKRVKASAHEFAASYHRYTDRYGEDGSSYYAQRQYYEIVNTYKFAETMLMPLL
jgi:hypothetical protein